MGEINLCLAYWVHDLSPFLIRFGDNFGIRYYGLAYLLGFLCAALLLRAYYKKGLSPFDAEAQSRLMTFSIMGVLVGGRLGYMLFYNLEGFFNDPLSLFKIWEGGMSSHGGFIGVALAVWLFYRFPSKGARTHRQGRELSLLRTADLVVSLTPLGFFFGRIANFINGELWGKVSTVPWAVIFPQSAEDLTMPVAEIPPRHPSQLYEAVLEGLLLFLWTQWRLRRKPALPEGQLAGEFLVIYAVARIFAEVFREPDRGISLILGLSRGQFYSLFIAASGLFLIGRCIKKQSLSSHD